MKNKDKPRDVKSNNFPYCYEIDMYYNWDQIEKNNKILFGIIPLSSNFMTKTNDIRL